MSELPEKVVQFGTGAFLRGFVEYFIDAANRSGKFNGRIVAIGSTPSGRDRRINDQHGRYTLAIRGIYKGDTVSEYRPIDSLSRALPASTHWNEVLECARNEDLELIFSNTTETGIRLDEEDTNTNGAPASYPGKLTAFLFERAKHFSFDRTRVPIVIPCELIERNGDELRRIVREMTRRWKLGAEFERWLNDVGFCNTLVDRIVPGELSGGDAERAWQEIGYKDELVTSCEPYRLFAIQAPREVWPRLTFADADPGVVLCDDVTPYRERKVRLLNGTHTIMVPAALLAGCTTVREAMEDEVMAPFIRSALFDELVRSTSVEGAQQFAEEVVDRFRNPFIRHALLDITLQQTMKMRVRVVPAIRDYAQKFGQCPKLLAFGFAAYLHAIVELTDLKTDDQAAVIRAEWGNAGNAQQFVRRVCSNAALWEADLSAMANFTDCVERAFARISDVGVRGALS